MSDDHQLPAGSTTQSDSYIDARLARTRYYINYNGARPDARQEKTLRPEFSFRTQTSETVSGSEFRLVVTW